MLLCLTRVCFTLLLHVVVRFAYLLPFIMCCNMCCLLLVFDLSGTTHRSQHVGYFHVPSLFKHKSNQIGNNRYKSKQNETKQYEIIRAKITANQKHNPTDPTKPNKSPNYEKNAMRNNPETETGVPKHAHPTQPKPSPPVLDLPQPHHHLPDTHTHTHTHTTTRPALNLSGVE